MKKTILLISIIYIFTGCSELSLEEQRANCIKKNKTFTAKKTMNFRTGEYEIRGECK